MSTAPPPGRSGDANGSAGSGTAPAAAARHTRERITTIRRWSDHLFSFRTTRDAGFRFVPGQFARLGVCTDEGGSVGGGKVGRDGDGNSSGSLVWRAYSVVSAPADPFLEFYSIVIADGAFTPALARLQPGDPLLVERASYGFLTLDRFEGGTTLWLLATGTGIAPFVSMLQDPSTWSRYRRVVLVHSVRQAHELAYREELPAMAAAAATTMAHAGGADGTTGSRLTRGDDRVDRPDGLVDPARLVYVPVVTRERAPGALHGRIPALLESGELERAAGVTLNPLDSRIMLCGNPGLVDDLRHRLSQAGYAVSRRTRPAQMAVESYW